MTQQPHAAGSPSTAPDEGPSAPTAPVRLLAAVTAGLGVAIYLLGFFAGVGLATGVVGPLLVGGGLLVGATVLPRAGRVLVPGAVAVAVGMLLLLQAVAAGRASAMEVIALVLAFLQAVAAIGAVLLDEGILTAPTARPKAPVAPLHGGYPPAFGPQPGYGQPPYGQAPHGQAAYGQPGPYGQPGSGIQPGYGQPAPTQQDQPAWAQRPSSEPARSVPPWYATGGDFDDTVATPAPPGAPVGSAPVVRPGSDTSDATSTIRPDDATPSTGQPLTPVDAAEQDSATTRFLPSSDEGRRN